MHGLLLLSHGSRDPRAAAVVEELVQAAGSPVRPAGAVLPPRLHRPGARRGAAADGSRRLHLGARGVAAVHPRVPRDPRRAGAIEASGVAGRMDVSVAPALVSDEPRARELLLRALGMRLTAAHPGDVDAHRPGLGGVQLRGGSIGGGGGRPRPRRGARRTGGGCLRVRGGAVPGGRRARPAERRGAAPGRGVAVRGPRPPARQRDAVGRRRAGGRSTGRRRRFRRPAADAG